MKATRVIGLMVAAIMATALFGGVVYAEPPVHPASEEAATDTFEHEKREGQTRPAPGRTSSLAKTRTTRTTSPDKST